MTAAADTALFRAHADACMSCARYDRVVRRGAQLARDLLPRVHVSEDFEPRVRHRLFHVRDEMARPRAGSAPMYASAASVVVIAAVTAMLMLSDRTPIVDAQVVWASAPGPAPALEPLTPLEKKAVAVPHVTGLSLGSLGATPAVTSLEAAAAGHDPHVATPATWPVYSRNAMAVAFPASQTSLVVGPADFRRGAARTVAGPLLIRH